jgi:uncharacterized protein (DUF433 family)
MGTGNLIAYPHVTNDPDVCGGQPCVGDTGVRVTDLAAAHEDGQKPGALTEYFSSAARPLTLPEVFAGLAYYYDNLEILQQIREDNTRAAAEAAKQRDADILKRFLGN